MASTLFNTNNKLDEYRDDPTIKIMLDGCVLLNHSEFISWFKPPSITKATRNANSKYRRDNIEEVGYKAFDILDDLADVVCKGKIGRTYGQHAIRNVSENFNYKKNDLYDILVAVEPRYNKINPFRATNTVENDKLQSVLGFIIVEKGECKLLKDIYSVHLICSRESKSKAIKGVILLGAYLYCIKSSDEITDKNKRGILELAGGYMNLSGFFAYSKLGFNKDNSLYNELNCFKDAGNLPMSVDLTKYSSRDIIDMVNGTKKRNDIEDDTGIYQIGVPKDEIEKRVQTNVAILSNMKQLLVLDKEPTGEDYRNIIHDVVDKTDKFMKIKKLDEYIRSQLAQLNIKIKRLSKQERNLRRQRIRERRSQHNIEESDKSEELDLNTRKRLTAKKRKRSVASKKKESIASEKKESVASEKKESKKNPFIASEKKESGEISSAAISVSKESKKVPFKKKIACESPKNATSKKRCARNGNCCVISG
jgi:hypothetical protein